MKPAYFAFVATLVALGHAGPIQLRGGQDQTTCAKQCKGNDKFNYKVGVVYQYDYLATTSIQMNGASSDEPTISLRAKVEFEPVTACDIILKIVEVKLQNAKDVSQSTRFQEALTSRTLRFAFQDGLIEGVCPMAGEPTWVLNMKRGILSAFQNSMDNLKTNVNIHETDVGGNCLTLYSMLENNGRTLTVLKRKDLLSCTDRESYRVAMQSMKYNVDSNVNSLPLLKGVYECRQTLDLSSNTLQKSECTEEHVFRPFSNGNSGAMNRVKQVLTFANIRRAGRAADEGFSHRTTLMFEHEHGMVNQRETEQEILSNLLGFCKTMDPSIGTGFSEKMNELVEYIRQADYDTLRTVYSTISRSSFCQKNSERTKKYFLDAIPMAGTTSSVKLMQDLISREHVTGTEAQMWLLSLSFIHHPTKDMVAAIMPLLDDQKFSENAILPISSLASTYCSRNPNCGNDIEIENLIKKLLQLVGRCDSADDTKTMHALRALGNVGHSTRAVPRLSKCITQRSNPMNVRISAIDAFRKVPCEATRSDLMGVFTDVTEDSEIRINAYIALMRCPNYPLIREMKSMLERERTNQVGSFVWSHLTNLMETSDPHLQEIRSILEDEKLKKEFNLDNRKFSRNYENSFFFDTLNAGAKAESNVIFSEKSFVPRSANLNLTVDLFGNAINVLEIGGRVEGLEQLLEKHFSGYAMTKHANKDEMDKVSAALYMRIFGNELYYNNKIASNPMSLFSKAEKSLFKSMQLVDSRMTVPTCIGLPLNLTVTTTGGIDYDVRQGFANEKYTATLKLGAQLQVKGQMSVDAHITSVGLKMLTSALTSTGAEIMTKGKFMNFKLLNQKSEFFNIKSELYTTHGVDEKKQDLITDNVHRSKICSGQTLKSLTGLRFCQELRYANASHRKDAPFFPFTGPFEYDLYMMNEDAPNNYVVEYQSIGPNGYMSIDTPGSQIRRKTTLKMQGDTISLSTPWRNIKMDGTFTNGRTLKLIKGQVSIDNKIHKMLAQLEMESTRASFKFIPKFILNSKYIDLAVQGNLDCVYNKRLDFNASITGSLMNPITLKVSGLNVQKGMAATSVLKIGKKEYSLISRIGKVPKKSGFKLSPYLKLTMFGEDKLELTSDMNYDGKNKGVVSLKLDKVFKKSISVNGLLSLYTGKTKKKHILKLNGKSPWGTSKVVSDIEIRPAGTVSRAVISYGLGANRNDQLIFTSKTRSVSTKKAVISSGSASLQSKNNKERNFNVKGKMTRTTGHSDINIDLTYGNPKNKATNNLKFNAVVNYKIKPIARECNFALSLKHPSKDNELDIQIRLGHFHTNIWPIRRIDNKIFIKITPSKFIETDLSYSNVRVKGLQKTDAQLSLNTRRREMEMKVKVNQLSNNALETSCSVQWQKGEKITLETLMKNTPQVFLLENTVSFPNNKNAKLTTTVNKNNNDYNTLAEFHADQGIITEKDVKAIGNVKYTFNRNDISADVKFELESGTPKKISFTASHHNIIGTTVTTKISLNTPFKFLESYSDSIEQTINNKKRYTYIRDIQWKSNGNENEIKMNLDYNLIIKEFDYTYHSSVNSITTDIQLLLKNSENKNSALFKVKHDKPTPLIFIKIDHTNDRRQVTTDASLMFDMYNSNGNVKYAMQKDNREITSSGDLDVKISSYSLVSSYSLKHNKVESSVKLDYTSSSRNHRKQGSISSVVTKNMPQNLKADVSVTLNNRPQLKMVVDYIRSKENFDVNAEVTGPNAKKITATFNLNLSGTRKTSRVQFKSDSTDVTIGAATESQGRRYFDSELQIGINGKNLLLSGNYKKESSNHKINGHVGLPDSRRIEAQASFNNAAKKSFSFNVDSPDFPSLSNINMDISVQPDNVNPTVEAAVKVLPYLENTELKASLTGGKMFEASVELETPFHGIRQAKVIVSLEIDRKKFDMINVKTFVNSKKFSSLKIVYNIRSLNDFNVKIIGNTPHKRYDEFLFDITHRGDLMNFDSNVEMKAGKVFVFKSTLKNSQRNTDIDANINMGDKTLVSKFVRSESGMTINMSYKIRQNDQYTAHMNINGKQNSLQLMAPGDKKFDADMTFNPSDAHFNLETILQLGPHNDYKILATYDHKSKLHLKLATPSYNGELMMTFSGTLESFNYQADLTHNNDKYGVTVFNKDKQFKATVMTPSTKSKMDLTKTGGWDIFTMNLEAKHKNNGKQIIFSVVKDHKTINVDLKAPSCEIQLQLDNTIKNAMLNVSIKNIKFELFYTDKIAKPKTLSLTMSTPKHNLVMKINVADKKYGIGGNVVATYNGEKFNLDGSYETMGQKKIFKAGLKSMDFNDDITVTVSGKLKKFKASAKLQHNKDVYEATMSNKAFKTLNLNMYAPGFKLKMDFEGELQKFKFFTSMNIGKKQFKGLISNQNHWKGINAEITIQLANYEMKYDFDGDMGKMYFSTRLLWRQNEYSLSTSVNVHTHSYSLSISLPLFILKANIMNGFQSSNLETKVVFDHATYGLTAFQGSNNFSMSITQLGKQKLDILLTKTSVMVRFQDNNDVHEYYFTFDKQGFTANFSSFDNKGEMKAKFNDLKDFTVNARLVNKRSTYKLDASNKKNKQMSFRATMPDGKVFHFQSDNTGSANDGTIRSTIKYGEYSCEYNGKWEKDERRFQYQMDLKYKSRRTLATFNLNTQLDLETKIITHSLNININNRKSSITSTIDLSRGLVATFALVDPYTGNIELKVNANPLQSNRIKSTVKFSSYLTGDIKLNYEHTLTKASFTSKGYIETESDRFANYEIKVNFPDYVYDIKMDYKNGEYNVNSKGSLGDGQKSTSIQVKTPYRYLRDVTVSAESYSNRMLQVSVTFPRQFYAAKMDWKSDSLTTEIDLHMDRVDKKKQFKIIMSYGKADDRTTVSRETTFKLIHDDIVLTSYFQWKKSYDMIMLKGEFSWGEEDNQKIGAELHIKTAEKKEVSLTLRSPRRTSVMTCSQESGRNQYNIMCALIPDASKRNNKIEIDADISNYNNKNIFDITIKLPNQKNAMKLKTITNGPKANNIFSMRTQFSVDQDIRKTLTMDTKLNNNNGNYTLDIVFDHPYSNLALEILAFATATQHRYSTGMELNYMTSKRKQESLKLRADINKQRHEASIDIMLPNKHIEMFGSVESDDQFMVTLKKKETGMKDMQATAAINRDGKSMYMEMNYDQTEPKKIFRMKGEIMNKKIMLKGYRSMGQQVNKDGRMSIEMRPSSVLLTQIIWNPDSVNELNDYCYAVLEHYGNEIKSLGDRIAEFLSEEISMKGKLMQKAFSEPLDTITNFMSSEYDLYSRDVAKHARKIGELYERDSFYMKSMHMSAVDLWDSMWASYQNYIGNFWGQVRDFNMQMSHRLDKAKIYIDYYYTHFQRRYQMFKYDMSRKINEGFEYIQKQYNIGVEKIQMYINRCSVIVKRVHRQMKEHPLGKSVIENGEKIFNKLYQQMSSHPWAKSMGNIGSKVYQQAEWAFNYWEVKENLYSLKDKTVKYIRRELNMLADAFTDLDMNTLMFDPKKGEIILEFHYRSLMMTYKYAKSIQQTLESINRVVMKYVDMLPTSFWSITDIYYALKPYTSVYNWLPPFDARATVFGSHIQTFDGRHIDYMGTCSHTLAYSEGNFKVVANYSPDKNQPRINSITFTTGDNERINVFYDYRVTYKGRPIKLPIKIGNMRVFRTNDIINMGSREGYMIQFNPTTGLTVVDVSGWYFNRVSGLLGTNNNEQFDDMITPNKLYTFDVEEFADSWMDSVPCRSQNLAESHNVPVSHVCTAFFRDTSSPFRDCFKQVNPTRFFSVCNSYVYTSGAANKVICDLADYYESACRFKDVYFTKLPFCKSTGKKRF